MRSIAPLSLALCVPGIASCLGGEPRGASSGSDALIYGDDDRIEAYEPVEPDVAWLFASEAAVFWEPDGLLVPSGDGYAIATSPTFGESQSPLCAPEPYQDQPVPATCSAFFVGADLMVTAGHCMSHATACRNTSFVFGFHMLNATTPVTRVSEDDVYECESIVASVHGITNDYAVVRVDRPVVGRRPLPLRRGGTVEGDPKVAELAVVGHPVGMPAKYADGASIIDASHTDFFSANLDVYDGNSGSPVVSLDSAGDLHLVEGILVRGNPDWHWTGTCYVTAWCPDTGCDGFGEEVTRATNFASYVPVACGDGVCDASEDCESCASDCGACVVCGDGLCDASEGCESCASDCGACTTCEPRGASCSSDDDCCSGKCRGRPGAMRCRGSDPTPGRSHR